MLTPSQITKLKKSLRTEDASLAKVFSVLGDKSRYRIIELLARNEKLCVSDLAAILDISLSCASQHLRILEMSGLVESERSGQTICYRYKVHSKLQTLVDLM